MIAKLSAELKQALANQPPGTPLSVEDPETHDRYVLVQMDVFERMQQAISYDDSGSDPRDFAPMINMVMEEDWNAPGMDEYDNYQSPQTNNSTDES